LPKKANKNHFFTYERITGLQLALAMKKKCVMSLANMV
jgi:hypothetical protein